MQHSELRKLLLNSNLEELIKDNYNTYQVQQRLISSLKPDFKFHYNPIINFAKKTLGYTWDSSEKRWIYNENNIEKVEETKDKKTTKKNTKDTEISTVTIVNLDENPMELFDKLDLIENRNKSEEKLNIPSEIIPNKAEKNNNKKKAINDTNSEEKLKNLEYLKSLSISDILLQMRYHPSVKISIMVNQLILDIVDTLIRTKSNKKLSQTEILEIALEDFITYKLLEIDKLE